jgi:diguanylate cyclase (GGDEF)-like protein/PAS domain S-box-containing protein
MIGERQRALANTYGEDPTEVEIRLRAERDAAVQSARDALADMSRLTRLLTLLSDPGSVEQVLERTVDALSELFSADLVMLLTPATADTCTVLAAAGLPEDMLDVTVESPPEGPIARAVRTNAAVLSQRLADVPGVDSRFHELGLQTAVWAPMCDSQGSIVGVICVARAEVAFGHEDVTLLQSMAHRVGLAVEQAQRTRQLEQLARVAQAVGRELEESAILDETVRHIPELLGADGAVVFLVDQHFAVRRYVHRGVDADEVAAFDQHLDNLTSSSVLRSGEPYLTADLRSDPNRRYPWPDVWRVRGVLAVPIMWGGHVQGALLALRFTTAPFTADAVRLATLYASQVAAALENARLFDHFRALIRGVSDVIAIVDENQAFQYVSPAAESAWGCQTDDLRGENFFARIHPDDRPLASQLLAQVGEEPGTTVTGGLRVLHAVHAWRDFELILSNQVHDPAINGIIVTYHDNTERKMFESQLSTLAFRDAVTDLPNRVLFMDRLEHALRRSSRVCAAVGVLFIDLDNFKVINDSLGHAAGDAVLAQFAERLQSCVRAEDTAARLGGDEFTVLIEQADDPSLAIGIAERVHQALLEPFHLASQDVFTSASIGIALSNPDATDQVGPDELLRNADLAMYRAKSNGKAQYALFQSSLTASARDRLALETDLRLALERGDLRVNYQPIVSLVDESIPSVEALVRWQHPSRGLIPPDQFIPLAEETGLIVPLGLWVLEEACRQARAIQREVPAARRLRVSVNLSPRQIAHPSLVEDVARALERTQLDAASLILEITETAVMQDMEEARRKLQAIKAMGVGIAIDDFGTGYSSLSVVTRVPLDILKIDRSFVRDIEHEPNSMTVVRSVVALADGLGLKVTAEGVETHTQLRLLRSLGCGQGQGYLFARPLPADGLRELLTPAPTDEISRAA